MTVSGSIATRVRARPSSPHWPDRISDTVATALALRSLSPTAGGTPPWAPATVRGVTTKSARRVSWMVWLAELLMEAARMATTPTRVIPIIRAAAVADVRRGLRMALSRPSTAGSPKRRIRGMPITRAAGAATRGVSMAIPTRMPADPRPMASSGVWTRPKRPMNSEARPTPVTPRPEATRRPNPPCSSAVRPTMAAMGETLVDR